MITDRRILTAKLNLYGMSSFHFYCWNQFKVFPLPSTLRTYVRTPKSFAFGVLANSGCQNSAMITDCRKLEAKINLCGMSSFHFYCWNQFIVVPLLYTPYRGTYVPQQFRCWLSDADYALCDIFVITRWRHELYTYSKLELLGLFCLKLKTVTVQKITLITGNL